MKTKKKIKVAILSLFGFAFLLFVVLIIHVGYMVHKRAQAPDATIQMARADFSQQVDSVSAKNIQAEILKQKGVKSTYFNLPGKILVYTFNNKENTAQKIYDNAIANSGFTSARHIVSAADMNKGCPVMNPNSFYGKLSTMVAKVVN